MREQFQHPEQRPWNRIAFRGNLRDSSATDLRVPFVAMTLKRDSVSFCPVINFNQVEILDSYLSRPGVPSLGSMDG